MAAKWGGRNLNLKLWVAQIWEEGEFSLYDELKLDMWNRTPNIRQIVPHVNRVYIELKGAIPGGRVEQPPAIRTHSPLLCCAQALSHVRLSCNPMDGSPSGSSVHGIFQARVLGWVGIFPPSRDLLTQGWNLPQASQRRCHLLGHMKNMREKMENSILIRNELIKATNKTNSSSVIEVKDIKRQVNQYSIAK